MLYINITTKFHFIDKSNSSDYGIETTGGEDLDYMLNDIIDSASGKVDVDLFVCEIVRSKEREENSYFYELKTTKSLFDILDYIEEHVPETTEIYDYWRAQRRDCDYYLELVVYSVSKELISDYISMVSEWCRDNGEFTICESFAIPPETSYDDHEYTVDIPIELIKKVEKSKKPYPNNIPINWDTGFPGFEGAGSDVALTWVGLGLTGIGTLLTFFGLYTTIDQIKDKRRIKKLRKEIYNKFDIKGILQDPDVNRVETDRELRRIYRFTELFNNDPCAYYVVQYNEPCHSNKKARKPSYIITEEKVQNRKSNNKK